MHKPLLLTYENKQFSKTNKALREPLWIEHATVSLEGHLKLRLHAQHRTRLSLIMQDLLSTILESN